MLTPLKPGKRFKYSDRQTLFGYIMDVCMGIEKMVLTGTEQYWENTREAKIVSDGSYTNKQ